MHPIALHTVALAGMMAAFGTAQAALHDRGGGMIYDDVLHITWLQDTNFAKTSLYSGATSIPAWDAMPGAMSWDSAMAWADQLVYGGFDDWRLPSVKPVNGSSFNYDDSADGSTDVSTNINSPQSELAHLYYVTLGNIGSVTVDGVTTGCYFGSTTCWTNRGPFENFGAVSGFDFPVYWASREYDPWPSSAWIFYGYAGEQTSSNKNNAWFAWAVRDGDVAAVPEPETYSMILAGLITLGLAVRRRPNRD
jgi:hypothetical protein